MSRYEGARTGLFRTEVYPGAAAGKGRKSQQQSARPEPSRKAQTPKARAKPKPTRSSARPGGAVRQTSAATGTGLFPKLETRRNVRNAQSGAKHAPDHAAKRDALITAAINANKIRADRREHFEKLYDADPTGTRQLLEMCAPTPGLNDPPKAKARPRGTGLFTNRGRR